MPITPEVMKLLLLAPLSAVVFIYYDLRYRRIPNVVVLSALVAGIAINTTFGGVPGRADKRLRVRPGFLSDVVIAHLRCHGRGRRQALWRRRRRSRCRVGPDNSYSCGNAWRRFGDLLDGEVGHRLCHLARSSAYLGGFLPGWEMPRFAMPPDRRHTIPYGVAIMMGSLISSCRVIRG